MAAKSNKNVNIKRLVLTAMLIALGTALSMVKIWQMPLGGAVTLLSMLPIALISIEYGVAWGMGGAFAYSLVQLGLSFAKVLSWGLSPAAVVGTFVFDYILAFTFLGLSGLFRKKGVPGIIAGLLIAMTLRLVCHVISGAIIFGVWMPEDWSNPWLYSICYNGLYMLPEFILTTIGSIILFKTPGFGRLVSSNLK